MVSNKDELTPQQLRFCEEFIVDCNATKAAIRAGYSEKAAHVQGCRLLKIDKVQIAIQNHMSARSNRVQVSSDTVLNELLKLATSDMRKLFNEKGELLSVDEWPDDIAMSVASVEVEEIFDGRGADREHIGYTKKVKFWDKPKSLELLGRHLKLFTDKIDVSGKITLADLVAGSQESNDDGSDE